MIPCEQDCDSSTAVTGDSHDVFIDSGRAIKLSFVFRYSTSSGRALWDVIAVRQAPFRHRSRNLACLYFHAWKNLTCHSGGFTRHPLLPRPA